MLPFRFCFASVLLYCELRGHPNKKYGSDYIEFYKYDGGNIVANTQHMIECDSINEICTAPGFLGWSFFSRFTSLVRDQCFASISRLNFAQRSNCRTFFRFFRKKHILRWFYQVSFLENVHKKCCFNKKYFSVKHRKFLF